jgi:hypothetical protein
MPTGNANPMVIRKIMKIILKRKMSIILTIILLPALHVFPLHSLHLTKEISEQQSPKITINRL